MTSPVETSKGRLHWLSQRISGILLWAAAVYLGFALRSLFHLPYTELRQNLAQLPLLAAILISSFIVMVHTALGLQVIAEDYVPQPLRKYLLILLKLWIAAVCLLLILLPFQLIKPGALSFLTF